MGVHWCVHVILGVWNSLTDWGGVTRVPITATPNHSCTSSFSSPAQLCCISPTLPHCLGSELLPTFLWSLTLYVPPYVCVCWVCFFQYWQYNHVKQYYYCVSVFYFDYTMWVLQVCSPSSQALESFLYVTIGFDFKFLIIVAMHTTLPRSNANILPNTIGVQGVRNVY